MNQIRQFISPTSFSYSHNSVKIWLRYSPVESPKIGIYEFPTMSMNEKQNIILQKNLALRIAAAFSCQNLIAEIQYSGMFVAE